MHVNSAVCCRLNRRVVSSGTRGNILKIWDSHQVRPSECEEVYFNQPFGGRRDEKHSETEERHFAFGRTNEGRLLTVIYTTRNDRLRVVNAWPMSRKERRNYAEAIAHNS